MRLASCSVPGGPGPPVTPVGNALCLHVLTQSLPAQALDQQRYLYVDGPEVC